VAQEEPEAPKPVGPRKQLAIIIFSGLGGMVLGLSTLSFYGRPQEKLANIGIGFGIGVIVGTLYTGYSAATKPRELYMEEPLPPPTGFLEVEKANRLSVNEVVLPIFAYSHSF
jgi:hypothetical protein